jgi:hypothetical protein
MGDAEGAARAYARAAECADNGVTRAHLARLAAR